MKIIEKIDIRPDWYIFMIDNKIKNNKIEEYLKLSYEYERKAAELITTSFIKNCREKNKQLEIKNCIFENVRKDIKESCEIIIEDDLKLK